MHAEHAEEPRSVAELAADPAWVVTRTGTTGQWLTAERVLTRDGHQRLVGLTPIRPGTVALMLWAGGEVVGHFRGSEAEACATALRWTAEFLAGER
ncbi:hypothetical protein M8542_31530 [Amycolatopsis sp. OK19-0408]|uniref:Uncharacterized protein n=1 Tax=Amycolatopsis iheyensis TaxID=2945988 RepID=A0A9X2NHA6_9PSEU|nr:hypothetical protein [Amycolatopsis iheyensis]MCR6487371.1 hypothetical protein [Amycolatopsis iheyensis]